MLLVVNYHYVRPRFEDQFGGVRGVTPRQLEQQLALLGRQGTYVSGEEIRTAIRGGRPLPDRALLVTFDDGFREQFEHALPVLDRLGIPALFFVNTQPVMEHRICGVHKIHLLRSRLSVEALVERLEEHGRSVGVAIEFNGHRSRAIAWYPYDAAEVAQLKYLLNHRLSGVARDAVVSPCFEEVFGTDEPAMARELYMDRRQLGRLGDVGYLGTHGHEHRSLSELSHEAVRESIGTSRRHLADLTGRVPFAFSYPYGSFECCPPAAQTAAAEAGIEVGFTMERAGNADLRFPLVLARFDANDLPGGRHPRLEAESMFEHVPLAEWYR